MQVLQQLEQLPEGSAFDVIVIGAGGAGMVPGLWMFNRAFSAGQFGYACAIGMILFVFILVLTLINNKYIRIKS